MSRIFTTKLFEALCDVGFFRSQVWHHDSPPCGYCWKGKEHLLEVNKKIGLYFETALPEANANSLSRMFTSRLSEALCDVGSFREGAQVAVVSLLPRLSSCPLLTLLRHVTSWYCRFPVPLFAGWLYSGYNRSGLTVTYVWMPFSRSTDPKGSEIRFLVLAIGTWKSTSVGDFTIRTHTEHYLPALGPRAVPCRGRPRCFLWHGRCHPRRRGTRTVLTSGLERRGC